METKVRQVRQKLEKGLAVLIYDDEMETTNMFRHDDPVLKKLDKIDEGSSWIVLLEIATPTKGRLLRNFTERSPSFLKRG